MFYFTFVHMSGQCYSTHSNGMSPWMYFAISMFHVQYSFLGSVIMVCVCVCAHVCYSSRCFIIDKWQLTKKEEEKDVITLLFEKHNIALHINIFHNV